MNFTEHASIRSAQRGITKQQIKLVLEHGHKIYRQGLVFHLMRTKDVPETLPPHAKGRLKGIVMVCHNSPGNPVITVYRSHKAARHIRKKPKRLFR